MNLRFLCAFYEKDKAYQHIQRKNNKNPPHKTKAILFSFMSLFLSLMYFFSCKYYSFPIKFFSSEKAHSESTIRCY